MMILHYRSSILQCIGVIPYQSKTTSYQIDTAKGGKDRATHFLDLFTLCQLNTQHKKLAKIHNRKGDRGI